MNELQLQDKYLIRFLCDKTNGLNYKEIKANIVSDNLFVKSDLQDFLSQTTLNAEKYKKLLRQYGNDENKLITEFIDALAERMKDMANMAIFINNTKTFTFKGLKFNLFYPGGGEFDGDKLFGENIFSVVQECSYKFQHEGKIIYTFRPDITFFVNGIYLSYSELKSTYNNQNAGKHGRGKVIQDYENAVLAYLKFVGENDLAQSARKDFLKIFEKAIHITATDLDNTYVIRTISNQFDEIKRLHDEQGDLDEYKKRAAKDFKAYPVLNPREAGKLERFEEVFKALYDKEMIEKEILYYNFIEREVVKTGNNKDFKNEKGKLISPRPKQKFGTDKIIAKIDEFLDHESDDNYFINKLADELDKKGVGEARKQELIEKRLKYQNNKNIYSLLLQYAAGFGKSNIIGWTTLQLKDIKKNGEYVYDKVMIVVDRLQLRDQIANIILNMNINKAMFIEADSRDTFLNALKSDTRIVIVNLQKFGTVKQILTPDVLEKLSKLRIAFLIDEIHRSNEGIQNDEMLSIFDELQSGFDDGKYGSIKKMKNLIVGFTATPTDHTLARFGEYNKYAEAEKLWIPFDYYTMKEAIDDGYILNPLKGIVPISAKMFFEEPDDALVGFEGDTGYEEIPDDVDTGVDAEGKKYAIRKKRIYENEERIEAIAKFVVERLVTTVYHAIRGKGKAMLAVSSIKAAKKYKRHIDKLYKEIIQEKKYERFKDAPVYIVYSASQDQQNATTLNDGATEEKVLQNFKLAKNGLIIVVDKLQTGFDEPRLHTLFLDKDIKGINAIQTISRVNRTTKYKNDCKILDFSYGNVNVQNIKKAFEHFSNIVVSDFDPLGDEKRLFDFYKDLNKSIIAENYFKSFAAEFIKPAQDTLEILKIQNGFNDYIRKNPKESKDLKAKINGYFKILNLIEYVIEIEAKYLDKVFLDFWRRFNYEYNNINRSDEIVDDVAIYFDNKIGIIEPHQPSDSTSKPPKKGKTNGKLGENGKYKFDIRAVIEKLNEQQEEVEKLIKDFQEKVDKLFVFIGLPENGNRLIAKMKTAGTSFSEDEIYNDFHTLYKKFIRRNRESLGEMFITETKDSVHQLCDDFEKFIQ
ncbi:MAG: DEAD/DEAH box helicase family protein [Pyrinomonadaceae bacterium]